jgi:hypothetical protein
LHGCGITQAELSEQKVALGPRRITTVALRRTRIHGMHTPTHDLARQISEWCGEPKNFALYLGKVKWLGLQRSWRLWGDLKAKRTPIKNRAAYFMSLTRKENIDQTTK